MKDPRAIRERLERARLDVARAEGEASAAKRELEGAREKLRSLLGCGPGEEDGALAALRARVESDEREAVALLDAAEEAATPPRAKEGA